MQRQASASLNSAPMPGPLACILHERASFELRDEDVEALRKKVDATLVLKACHSGQLVEAEAAKAKEAEEMRAWKVRCLRQYVTPQSRPSSVLCNPCIFHVMFWFARHCHMPPLCSFSLPSLSCLTWLAFEEKVKKHLQLREFWRNFRDG